MADGLGVVRFAILPEAHVRSGAKQRRY